jgi:hypothetical protein
VTRTLALLLAAATLPAVPAAAQTPPAASAQAYAPLFAAEVERARRDVDASIEAGINVPVPKDPGGGFTHEQHKRNYRIIFEGGQLFRLTGDTRYRDHVRGLLLAYADLYPGLGPHPAKANQNAGRLFWQSLNDSVFLVNAVQGYAQIRDALSAADRKRIDGNVIRPMARFLSDESPQVINRIHNHATWAAAGVGLSGYLLRRCSGSTRAARRASCASSICSFRPTAIMPKGPIINAMRCNLLSSSRPRSRRTIPTERFSNIAAASCSRRSAPRST